MFRMKNGILYKNDQPCFGLGLSYYPSYHPRKCPVRPEDDRIGELHKDIRDMTEAGFNLVRFAALGDLKRTGPGADGIEASFPLIDECLKATEQYGIASQVRLQGYSLNVSGYTGEAMVTPEGRELDLYESFLYASLNHKGLLQDNEDCTIASARHFAPCSTLVGYQIYNEPNYTCGVDYNPHSIQAYREWLVQRGLATKEEAENLNPPTRRPQMTLDPIGGKDEDYRPWMYWRLFHYEKLNWFISHLGKVARSANPKSENMTCLMAGCPMGENATMVGEDFFRIAEGMEAVGITHYSPCFGETIYTASEQLDAAESAAALYGKHTWLVEYNARTNMPGNEWDRETYNAIGAGIKGIMYYQWRADYPYPDGPEPDQFGILFSNREKTAAYSHAVRMNRLINDKLSERIALAEKLRSGVAILFSEKANACCDALEGTSERIASGMLSAYRSLRKAGVPVDFVRASDLKENKLGVKLLILPARKHISMETEMTARCYYDDEELALIEAFSNTGGRVMEYCQSGGFRAFRFDGLEYSLQELPDGNGGFKLENAEVTRCPINHQYQMHGHLQAQFSAADLLEDAGIEPLFTIEGCPQLDARIIGGKDYALVCLTNSDPKERRIPAGKILSLNAKAIRAQKVTFYTPEEEQTLSFTQCDRLEIALPEIHIGGFVLIEG